MIIGQKALIKDRNKYLIVKKAMTHKRFPGHWDFPGGVLKKGEEIHVGVKREIMEETALEVGQLEQIWDKIIETPYGPIEYRVFKTNYVGGDVIISHEHSDYKWATKEEILKLKVQSFVDAFFKDY